MGKKAQGVDKKKAEERLYSGVIRGKLDHVTPRIVLGSQIQSGISA